MTIGNITSQHSIRQVPLNYQTTSLLLNLSKNFKKSTNPISHSYQNYTEIYADVSNDNKRGLDVQPPFNKYNLQKGSS